MKVEVPYQYQIMRECRSVGQCTLSLTEESSRRTIK